MEMMVSYGKRKQCLKKDFIDSSDHAQKLEEGCRELRLNT
jgi:hypothetical protein